MQAEKEKIAGFSVTEAQIRQVVESDAGKQLLALLQKKNQKALQTALAAAKQGDTEAAKQTINALLADREAAALLAQLGHG